MGTGNKETQIPEQATTPVKILAVTTHPVEALEALDENVYRVEAIDKIDSASEKLRETEYDLIFVHDISIEADIVDFIQEIKRSYALVPVLVFTNSRDITYETDLIEAGADDILLTSVPIEDLNRRLKLTQHQREENRALARRNRNLHSITTLSQRLHTAINPQVLILETIDLVASTFGLYGMVIALEDGERIHLYAGAGGVSDLRNLHQSTVTTHPYDLFGKTIETGNVQIYYDLKSYRYYVPIPLLADATSAIVMPLYYGDTTFGALAVMGTEEKPVSRDDLVIYEMVAAHFSTAYHNVLHYVTQTVSAQTSRQLLRAWQRLTTLNNIGSIAGTLQSLIQELPRVGNSLIWLYSDERYTQEVIVQAPSEQVIEVFNSLYEAGHIDTLVDQFDDRMQPQTLWLGRRDKQDSLGPLFRALGGTQLLILPIADSLRLIGGVIASTSDNQSFGVEDINLMESLAHATGQALERTVLISAMEEQTGRLEAILRAVDDEGIFFVADTGKIVFCNPQFTKLTGISMMEAMGEEPLALFDLLAARAVDSSKARQDLHHAVDALLSGHKPDTLELHLKGAENAIFIDLSAINLRDSGQSSWIGIIRDSSRFIHLVGGTQRYLLDMLTESISVPFAQLQSTINLLVDQHALFGNRERERMLRRLDNESQALGKLWDNFLQAYKIQVSGLSLEPEDIQPRELIERVLMRRVFIKNRRRVQINVTPPQALIHIDETYTKYAISNVLENALKFSPSETNVGIEIHTQENEVHIIVQDQGMGIPSDQVDHIFDPFYQSQSYDYDEGVGLGLYLARELIQLQGGRIWAKSRRGKGTTMTIAFPATLRTDDNGLDPETISIRTPTRNMEKVLVVEGNDAFDEYIYDSLEAEGYELLFCSSGEEALHDMKLTRVDMVIMDHRLSDGNSIDFVHRIRKESPVPIVLIAREAGNGESVKALEAGADEFIDGETSDSEMIARINNVIRRQKLQSRNLEPLELKGLYIDFAKREVYVDNELVQLTRIEYNLLYELATNRDTLLTHKQLLERVWGPEYRGENQYLWVNISRLRRKLEPRKDSPRYIHTQPGLGYIFREP